MYDAFGNEVSPDARNTNPFRYAGEYLDFETGNYYLRARFFNPRTGRFTQADPHWNLGNMVFGDDPRIMNEREDHWGRAFYTTAPDPWAIMQSGNLYVYCGSNPIMFVDPSGLLKITATVKLLVWGVRAARAKTAVTVITASGPIINKSWGQLTRAAEFGFKTYSRMLEAKRGLGLHAHHIIEQRFFPTLNQKIDITVAVTQTEHTAFTNHWSRLIPHGTNYANITKQQIWDAAQQVYADFPALLEAARQALGF